MNVTQMQSLEWIMMRRLGCKRGEGDTQSAKRGRAHTTILCLPHSSTKPPGTAPTRTTTTGY